MSSVATNFIPIPLHLRIGDNEEITDKGILNEKDFPAKFLDWFNKYKPDIEPLYNACPVIQEHFTLKEFAFELQAEMD
jgi:hypothetical protein